MNPTRRVLPLALAASLLGGCGPTTSDPGPAREQTAQPTDARAYLSDLVSGDLKAGAFVAVGDGVLAFGGYHTTGEVERTGVVARQDGSTAAFRADVGLVDASAVSVGSAVWVAGRQCDGTAERTDTGIACAPGTLRVIRIDTSSMTTEHIATGPAISDKTGSALLPQLFRQGDDVVLQVTTRTGRSLSTLSVAGEPHPLPAAPGPAQCSTGDTLIADGRPPTRGPGGPISFDGRIPQPDDPGIALLPTRRSKWHAIGAPPAGASGGDRACSAGWILVLPWSTSGRHIAYRDAQTGEWRESPSLEFNSTPYTITNPDTPSFVVTDGTTYTRIDPTRGTTDELDVPPEPLEGGPTWVLSPRGDLVTIGADLTLQVVS